MPATSASIDASPTRGREQVVEELHRLAGAELAAVEEIGAHAVEHRPAARDDLGGPADHQRQRARHRVIGGLADRAVDHRRAPFAAIAAPTLRVVPGSIVLMSM